MLVLGIESSCDETAAAIVEDGRKIHSSIVASQDHVHEPYGGVVPELASRTHLSSIERVVEKALQEADVSIGQVDGIAVTYCPGLIGSLLVGLSFAKALSYTRKIPFVGVHHIEGHLKVALLEAQSDDYPLMGLVASGGHTNLFFMESSSDIRCISQTVDDAAGEAFDKVAKLLHLGYPGGPAVDKASSGGNPNAIPFPRTMPQSLDFSFSGLKTAVVTWIQKNGAPTGKQLADVAASFQEAVVDSLLIKLFRAAKEMDVSSVAICGGVARNRRFRTRLEEMGNAEGLTLFLAEPQLCTDNAAMIAAAGYARLVKGQTDAYDLSPVATMPIGRL